MPVEGDGDGITVQHIAVTAVCDFDVVGQGQRVSRLEEIQGATVAAKVGVVVPLAVVADLELVECA